MEGPLQTPPFPQMYFFPFMTRPKPDGGIRIIVDLSWPLGKSVNTHIKDNGLDKWLCRLKYPTLDNLVLKIVQIGRGPRDRPADGV